jgi:ADP-ribose pyrophosphatase YjhB (NUDIX family)
MPRQYPTRPRIGVGAVVLRAGARGDEVLLVLRARPPRQGQWSLPGGLQKLGETVFAAAAREVAEETALEVEVVDVVEVLDLIETDPALGRIRYHYTLIDVLALWRAGLPVAGDDAARAAWFPVADLDRLALWSETVRVIERARQRWRGCGR